MLARILFTLIVVCSASTPVRSQEWNLFAVADTSAQDRCLVEWDLFTPAALVTGANEECESWNLFAAEPVAKKEPVARYGDRALLLLTQKRGCAPCGYSKSNIKPHVEKAGWPVKVVDFEDDPEFFDELNIDAVPTWIAVMRGQECGRCTGADRTKLYAMLRRANRAVLSGE